MLHVTSDRVKIRLACQMTVGDRRHSGVVLNVSPGGLFVQTNAKPGAGDPVEVALHVPGQNEGMSLDASVVWKRVVPARLTTVAHGGVGLRLLFPPERYYQFLADTATTHRPEVAPPGPVAAQVGAPASHRAPAVASEESKTRYRVRISQGPRTRTLRVEALTTDDARRDALAKAGSGWKVVDVQPV